MFSLKDFSEKVVQPTSRPVLTPEDDLVDLDQMAALMRVSKRSIERYRRKLPVPVRQGRCGRPTLWRWRDVRPWLMATFDLELPERLPGR